MNSEIADLTTLEIVEALKSVRQRVTSEVEASEYKKYKDSIWTYQFKLSLIELADGKGLNICAAGDFPAKFKVSREWLYDLVIYKNINGILNRVQLCLESEWSKKFSDIQYDFEKLLLARSDFRVMIFQSKGIEIEEYKNNLKNILIKSPMSIEGDKYILCNVHEVNGMSKIWVLTKEGHISATEELLVDEANGK